MQPENPRIEPKKFVKIGRPGYRVTKQRDSDNGQQSLLFQIDYLEIIDGIIPRHPFMSAYEQKIDPPDRKWQYLLFAGEPYETIAFKVPFREVEKPRANFEHTGHQAVLPAVFVQVGIEDDSTNSAEYARPATGSANVLSGSTASDGNGAGSTSYVSKWCPR